MAQATLTPDDPKSDTRAKDLPAKLELRPWLSFAADVYLCEWYYLFLCHNELKSNSASANLRISTLNLISIHLLVHRDLSPHNAVLFLRLGTRPLWC